MDGVRNIGPIREKESSNGGHSNTKSPHRKQIEKKTQPSQLATSIFCTSLFFFFFNIHFVLYKKVFKNFIETIFDSVSRPLNIYAKFFQSQVST